MLNLDTIGNHEIDEFFENYPTEEDYVMQNLRMFYEPKTGYGDNSVELAKEYKQMLKLVGEMK